MEPVEPLELREMPERRQRALRPGSPLEDRAGAPVRALPVQPGQPGLGLSSSCLFLELDAADDAALMTQINSGLNKYTNSAIATNEIFASTTPTKSKLEQTAGVWNIQKAVGGT